MPAVVVVVAFVDVVAYDMKLHPYLIN